MTFIFHCVNFVEQYSLNKKVHFLNTFPKVWKKCFLDTLETVFTYKLYQIQMIPDL